MISLTDSIYGTTRRSWRIV